VTRKFQSWTPEGVIPAVLLPFHEDFSIDVSSYRKHLTNVTTVRGIAAVTINAHSTEVHACSSDEQRQVLDVTADLIGDRLPIVHGVYADGSLEAAKIASMADTGGASALLVLPPNSMSMGGQLRPEMAVAHFRAIADATDLPIILFQYSAQSGLGYPFDTLLSIFDAVPTVKAIKDWCGDPMQHERHVRELQRLPNPVTVLSTHSAWLMSSLVMGCKGLLSGAGSVIVDLQVELFEAVGRQDLTTALSVNDRIYPLAQAFYAAPFLDMHNRMKEALVLLGRLPKAVVRPPLMKLGTAEITRLKAALAQAGLGPEGALSAAPE
jgi:4-hydroxy-tetrahydrodipicolinate synthase